jgi:endo-1,4-beta-xylanase
MQDPTGEPPLKTAAAGRGLLFGTATDRYTLEPHPAYAKSVVSECSLLTPENSMKWERLHPAPDRFDFENADWLVDFAGKNGLAVHGHALVWHLQNPAWLEEDIDSSNAETVMSDHIETVAGRYVGRMRSWDVVNEAIDPDYGRGDGLRPSPWLRALGPDYIALAFHIARHVEPDADLVYNDYDLEYEGDYFERRRSHVLDLLTGLVARGVPIHALGIQSHLRGHEKPDFKRFGRFLDEIAALGLDIMVTELDVRDQELPSDVEKRDCIIADSYKAYLDVVLDKPNLRSVAVWGLSDRFSWLSEFKPRADGAPVRPLPLDADLKRKPAWLAISEALAR